MNNNDQTEPRWTCANGHSNPATNKGACSFPGCGSH